MRPSHLFCAGLLCALLVSSCSSVSLDYRRNHRGSESSGSVKHSRGQGKKHGNLVTRRLPIRG